MKTYLLTGDIGGTNSRMGLYDASTNQEIKVEIYENEIHLKKVIVGGDDESNTMDGIFERKIIAPFLKLCWEDESLQLGRPEEAEIVASIAVCGPVRENKVTYMSNLPNVIIDGVAIVNYPFSVNIKVCKIINDFVAQGYGCLTLDPSEVRELYPNSHEKIDPYGPKVCVGAGTGLGVCYLTPDSSMGEGSYTCFPSEGGHVEWAPRDELEIELWKHLKMKFDYEYRISVERVVSGPGLVNCYEFLVEKFPNDIHIEWHEKFLNTKEESEKGKLVSQQAHAEETSLGRKAMEIMCGAYGSAAGSSAVKFIPTGGMYITGGLTPKNITFIENQGEDNMSPFMKAYGDKGRVSSVLDDVPLFAVMVEDLGLRGALKSAQIEYTKYSK